MVKTKVLPFLSQISSFFALGWDQGRRAERNEFKSKRLIKYAFLNTFSSDFKLEAID